MKFNWNRFVSAPPEQPNWTMKRLSSSVVYLLISGLALAAVAVHANKLPTNIDSSEIEITNEYDNNANDKQTTDNQNGDEMTTNDQIKLLTKQLAALTEHRQEDYRMLENSIHSFIRKNAMEFADADIKRELKDLRWAIGVAIVSKWKLFFLYSHVLVLRAFNVRCILFFLLFQSSPIRDPELLDKKRNVEMTS